MNLSKKSIGIVIGLAAIALIGLCVIQVQNLNSSIETNNQIFKQKVDLCSGQISRLFNEQAGLSNLLIEVTTHAKSNSNFNHTTFDNEIRQFIDGIFDAYALDLSYEYAVYEHAPPTSAGEFNFVLGDVKSNSSFDLTSCDNPEERSHSWSNLTCGNGQNGDYHLAVFFPNLESYLLAQSSSALVLAILFILLLLCCFAYMLLVIQRQKKLSVIKNDFINNLTHEFKTPIASIILATNMLKRGEEEITEERRSNYLNLIEHESKRLEGQVDKVLQIAMIDSGNFTLNKEHLNIHEIIHKVVDNMNLVVGSRKGQILLFLNASNPLVMADETHLINIIYNLVDNALKYTLDIPTIEITTINGEKGVEISIKDNGIGMGEEIQKYIFDKFYRAETGNIHNVKGFGLGLSYVKKIIEAHRGNIKLSSQINQGSEFKLYFPFS